MEGDAQVVGHDIRLSTIIEDLHLWSVENFSGQ
jgi:hypothetical protein